VIRLLIAVYDVIIFLPLAAERGIQQATAARRVAPLRNSEEA
jgi:hypothetical protein